ncbi:cytochrome c oxidase subunit 2A [Sporosarcina sp. P18a]|nr:cytochrome c oxidase subunit 2A [Sporosarcina sp. P16b]PIC80197.1 cytochrome c oxidase subunit 2A [Sporosarcina sp. P18a]PID02690.1 cytochrome c oxidase subunit 2A [Sporosarcina sp. P2]PID24006.1 cytochrome c oxidase subunit 2A [Sporosarcina sp. P7]
MSSTNQPKEEANLKGTLIMVMIIGIVILVMWFGAYGLFLSR